MSRRVAHAARRPTGLRTSMARLLLSTLVPMLLCWSLLSAQLVSATTQHAAPNRQHVFATTAAAAAADDPGMPPSQPPDVEYRNIIDLISNSPKHMVLTRLLQRSRLIPVLNKLQEFDDDNVGLTALAPVDSAWPKVLQEHVFRTGTVTAQAGRTAMEVEADDAELDRTLADALVIGPTDNVNEALQDLLLYHILDHTWDDEGEKEQEQSDGALASGQAKAPGRSSGRALLTTLLRPHSHLRKENPFPLLENGQKVWYRKEEGVARFGWSFGDASVSRYASEVARAKCTRGVMVSLDGILTLPPSFGEFTPRGMWLDRAELTLPPRCQPLSSSCTLLFRTSSASSRAPSSSALAPFRRSQPFFRILPLSTSSSLRSRGAISRDLGRLRIKMTSASWHGILPLRTVSSIPRR